MQSRYNLDLYHQTIIKHSKNSKLICYLSTLKMMNCDIVLVLKQSIRCCIKKECAVKMNEVMIPSVPTMQKNQTNYCTNQNKIQCESI